MSNMLAGSGPSPVGGGNNDGPSPSLSGTLGVAPQAAPQQGATPSPNMLGAGAGSPQPGMLGQPKTPMVPRRRKCSWT
jgi:hypothetical protein